VLTIAAALASNPPALPGFLNSIAPVLQHYGLWAIGLLITLEDFGVPVPGETILIAGALYAGAGRLNVVAVGLVGFIAAITGDNIGFAIGHFGGRRLALRWGKYVFLTEERLNKAEAFFDRRGAIVITFARFVEGLRQANGIIAGITGMHWLRFLIFNAIGAGLWVGTWVTAGYLAGNHIGTIYHYLTLYSYYALIALVLLILFLVIRHLRRRRLRLAAAGASRASEAHESRGTNEDAEVAADAPQAGGPQAGGPQAGGPQAGETTPGSRETDRAGSDVDGAAGVTGAGQENRRAGQGPADAEAAKTVLTEPAAGAAAADRHEPGRS
jgi:membrane protein DedA with SNARE-associated domain